MKVQLIFGLLCLLSGGAVVAQTELATGNGDRMFFITRDAIPQNLIVNEIYEPSLETVPASPAGSGMIDQVMSSLQQQDYLCEGCYEAFIPNEAIVVNGVPQVSKFFYNGVMAEGHFIVFRLAVGSTANPFEWRRQYPVGAITFAAADITKAPVWREIVGGISKKAVGGTYVHEGNYMRTLQNGETSLVKQQASKSRSMKMYPASSLDRLPVVQAKASPNGAPSRLPVGFLGIHAIGMYVNGAAFDYPGIGVGTTLVVRLMTAEEYRSPVLQDKLKEQGFYLKPKGVPFSFGIHTVGRSYG